MESKEKKPLLFKKLLTNCPRKHPKKALRKDSYKTHTRSGGNLGAIIIDTNRHKKETINPLSPFPNYL